LRKTPFLRRKLSKIAESCDQNIDPHKKIFCRKIGRPPRAQNRIGANAALMSTDGTRGAVSL
jgi:hypothetical protein